MIQSLKEIPEFVLDDLTCFISQSYLNRLPNSLLVAHAFILKYLNHGREFGLSEINYIIENGVKQGLFN